MLKGKTTMTLTKATIVAAVQQYLDGTFKESHVVTDIKVNGCACGFLAIPPRAAEFIVELDDGAEKFLIQHQLPLRPLTA